MEQIHSLLKGQIEKFFGSMENVPKELRDIIASVNETYFNLDSSRSSPGCSTGTGEKELHQTHSPLHSTFQGIPDLFVKIDRGGTILEYNVPATGIFHQLLQGNVLGRRICHIFGVETRKAFEQAIARSLEKRGAETIEYSFTGRTKCFCEARLAPLPENHLIVIIRDITDFKRAEEEQTRLFDEARNANAELKDFAYIVSHDLKAPLRGIKSLAEWIAADYSDKLDDNGKEQINLLLSRVGRMHNLIDGILQYSRIGRVKEEATAVNLNELIVKIIDTLTPPENIEISVENELPVLEFGETRITQVFQNLISNAIKYTDKPKGQIRIGCAVEDSFWKFSVSDNGPGIAEEYYEKIFKIFQTLAPKDEYESTGIGLSVVKKIVELAGGRVWVESKVGAGSTFFFTLPRKESEVIGHEKVEANIAC